MMARNVYRDRQKAEISDGVCMNCKTRNNKINVLSKTSSVPATHKAVY